MVEDNTVRACVHRRTPFPEEPLRSKARDKLYAYSVAGPIRPLLAWGPAQLTEVSHGSR